MKKNNYIQQLILVFVVILATPSQLRAQDDILTKILTSPRELVTLHYTSVDGENRPVELSLRLALPKKTGSLSEPATPAEIKYLVVHNHPTTTTNAQCPTGEAPMDAVAPATWGAMNTMTIYDAMVISCDYLGYGDSAQKIHPYMNYTLTGRNILDGILAALDYVKTREWPIASDYYTLNVGYSQGGQASMAFQRYLECEASPEEQARVNLDHSICGAGAYDILYVIEDLCSQTSLTYPCSLVMTLEGLKATYGESCMHGVDIDAVYKDPVFRDEIRAKLATKEIDMDDLNDYIHEYFGKKDVVVSDMFDVELLQGDNAMARSIRKALGKCNLLDGKWIPKHPITLFHYSRDEIVQPENSYRARELFGDEIVTFYNEASGLDRQLIAKYPSLGDIVKAQMSGATLTHTNFGTYFYVMVLAQVLD